LIERYGFGTGIKQEARKRLRYLKEIGEEIDRRLAKRDGKSVDQIIRRLEVNHLKLFV
jgi:hypothetical protein